MNRRKPGRWYRVDVRFGPGHQSRRTHWWEFAEVYGYLDSEEIDEEIKYFLDSTYAHTSQFSADWEEVEKPPEDVIQKKIKETEEAIASKQDRLARLRAISSQ